MWGDETHLDPLNYLLINKMKDVGLIVVEPIKLAPTWRNMKVEDGRVAKCFDSILILDSVFVDEIWIRKWIRVGGNLNHFPRFMEITKWGHQTPNPIQV